MLCAAYNKPFFSCNNCILELFLTKCVFLNKTDICGLVAPMQIFLITIFLYECVPFFLAALKIFLTLWRKLGQSRMIFGVY